MKYLFSLSIAFFAMILFPLSSNADVLINEANFPDANFRAWLFARDYGQDGVLTDDEIQSISMITITNQQIVSLQGIEFFSALTYLDCENNQLTSLDLSKNTELKDVWCNYNQLTTLDVSKNKALKSLECQFNQLTSLNVSNCSALTLLFCNCNQLTSLNVSDCTALKRLNCFRNKISGKNMDDLINSLPQGEANQVDGLYVINNYYGNEENVCTKSQVAAAKAKGWTPYYWNKTEIKFKEYEGSEDGIVINESNFPDANFRAYLREQDYGADGVLTEIEIKGILSLVVSQKEISSLQGIEYFTALSQLYCSNNQLTSLDVSKNTKLIQLYCYGNQLTSLDVSNCKALEWLACSYNQLTLLDVSKCKDLYYLHCSYNRLTCLDVSKKTALKYLYCNCNQLTSLDVSSCTALTSLACDRNKIKGANMDDLINCLPQNNTEYAYGFSVIDNSEGDEENVCTKSQVAAAKVKGWIPQYWDATDEKWKEYEGCDDVMLGDANDDGVVDVADVVAIVNYILEKPADNFNKAAADVNGDEVIDAADVVGVVNIILDKGNVDASRVRTVLKENGFIF